MIQHITDKNGITVRQLKRLVKDLPEVGDNDVSYTVWLANMEDSSLSNQVKSIVQLNRGDILLDIREF